jgi:signal transduction histidine kinase
LAASDPSAAAASVLAVQHAENARRRAGALDNFARSWFAPPLAIALAVLFIVVNEVGYRMVTTITEQRDDAVASRIAIGQLRGALVAAESAQRGLLLTERPVYRETFDTALRGIGTAVERMKAVAQGRPQEAKALNDIIQIGERKLSEMQETVTLLERGSRDAALALILSDIGREQMVEIDRRVSALTAAQMLELRGSAEQRDRVLLYSRYSILALVLSCLAAGLAAMRLVRHRDQERQAYVAALGAERDKLEGTVAERTRDLTELALHLQTVREDERSHLARELHDELGGLLTAAKLDLARMRAKLVQLGPEAVERVAHLRDTLDAGIALKRRIIEDLRPSSLDNLGLTQALTILCSEWSARTEVPVDPKLDDPGLSRDLALVVYRVVQESLTNIAKYARPRSVAVLLRQEGGEALLQVRDDGEGFALDQRTLGHGIAGMRFRVVSCGGRFEVDSAPGQGTRLTARLPLGAGAAAPPARP